jgi:hypothetical protein
MCGNEALAADHHPRVRCRLDVAEPIGASAESAHDHGLPVRFPILHDLKDGFTTPPGASPDMDQQQEPAPKQAAAPPMVEADGDTKQPST